MGEANSCVQRWSLLIRWLFISLPLWISCFLPLPLPLPPPSHPTPTLICSFCWLFAKRSVHSATSWKPIVTSDSGKVMHHSLGKTKNYIGDIKWHLQGIIPFGIFCTFSFSGNLPLARPIPGFKYLYEIFNQVVLCNEHIATLVLCLMYVGD